MKGKFEALQRLCRRIYATPGPRDARDHGVPETLNSQGDSQFGETRLKISQFLKPDYQN
jgi:hypothetical protein